MQLTRTEYRLRLRRVVTFETGSAIIESSSQARQA